MFDIDGFETLIRRARNGDEMALQQILLAHSHRLLRFVRPLIPQSLRPLISEDDILQQTFLQAFRDIDSFQSDQEEEFLTWLRTIARHRVVDAAKAQRRQKRGGGRKRVVNRAGDSNQSAVDLFDQFVAAEPTASRQVSRAEAAHAVRIAMAGLPEDYRQVIQLRYSDGHSVEDVARAMARTPGAVRGLLDRARKKMRVALGQASLYLSSRG